MKRAAEVVRLVVAWGLGVLLVWAPIPLGSNRPWSWLLLAVAIGLLLALWAVGELLRPGKVKVPVAVAMAAATTACVWAWAWLQAVPVAALPAVEWLTPHPLWAAAAEAGIEVVPLIGLDAAGTYDALARLMSYAAVFWLAFATAQDDDVARRLAILLLVVTTANAAYGLIVYFGGWNTILWFDKQSYIGDVTGTFVNRNHFATFANFGLIVALGFLLEPFLAARTAADARRIFVEAVERLLGRRAILLVAILILVTAVLQSHSRGGFLSGAIGVTVLFLGAFLMTRPRALLGTLVVAAVILAGWGFLRLSGEITLERLSMLEGQDLDSLAGNRLTMFADALALSEQRPMLGHGYGAFEEAFATMRRDGYSGVVDYAHNTYIEHLVELGLPATLLLYAGPLLLFFYCLRGMFARRRDQVFPLMGMTATLVVALHALVDFSIQIPAVAVTYAILLGIAVAQSIPSTRSETPRWGASLRE